MRKTEVDNYMGSYFCTINCELVELIKSYYR